MTLPVPHIGTLTPGSSATMNALIDAVNSLPRGVQGFANDPSGTRTIAALTTNYASTCSATFTLTDQRRVKVSVQARFVPNTVTTGRYSIQAGYNSGGSVTIGSVTTLGVFEADYDNPATSGNLGSDSQNVTGHVLLTPGTYTAYGVVQRLNGGDNGDTATGFAVLVEDIGAV